MMYKDKIKQLCQEQTNLDEADIEHLVQQADELLKNSAYANEDVFIDVKNIFSEHAIVIFHKKPESKLSLYENSVVGAMAYLGNEPGVIRTLETGAPSIGLSARSQEGLAIHQTVFPIVREERVIGTLIIEKNAPQTLPDHFSLDKRTTVLGCEALLRFQLKSNLFYLIILTKLVWSLTSRAISSISIKQLPILIAISWAIWTRLRECTIAIWS